MNIACFRHHSLGSGQRGFSLIELMVAITIGLLLMLGLVKLFETTNQSYLELHKAAQQIESARYAAVILGDDLRDAGYYGDFSVLPAAPGSLPDPCATSVAALTTSPYAYLAVPVQGYDSPTASPITSCLALKDFLAGTDILVIRRADTEILSAANPPKLNEIYIQGRMDSAEIAFGNPVGFAVPVVDAGSNAVTTVGSKPSGGVATVLKKLNNGTVAPALRVTGFRVAADIRKLHTHIYFVAPCSRPKGGGATCTGAQDDNGSPIPTLKRLELSVPAGGGALGWNIVPLVEGIENFQVEYGRDTTGDGMPDDYVSSPSVSDYVVSARLFILARSITATPGYSLAPGKAYCLASLVAGACPTGKAVSFSDNFKRHLYLSEVRLTNPSSRRETP
jgi:type IV pilus assembly protein PilW